MMLRLSKPSSGGVGLCLLLLAVLSLLTLPGCTATSSSSPQKLGTRVFSFTAFSSDGAWAATERGLLRTEDQGRTWRDVTPQQLRPLVPAIPDGPLPIDLFFRTLEGWLAIFPQGPSPAAVTMFRTRDAGRTWQSTTVQIDGEFAGQLFGGGGSLFFLDDNTGWLLATIQTSSAFSKGVLYGTKDGGGTWAKLSVPVAGHLRFISPSEGWLAGGPGGGELYATHDGGTTWEMQEVPNKSAEQPWLTTVAVAQPIDHLHGVFAVQLGRSEAGGGSDFYFYTTSTGGTSWVAAGSPVKTASDQGGGLSSEATALQIVDRENWFLNADKLYVTHNAGKTWSAVDSDHDLRSARSIEFVTPEAGWAYLEKTDCPGKTACLTESYLLRTGDGGQTWSDISFE